MYLFSIRSSKSTSFNLLRCFTIQQVEWWPVYLRKSRSPFSFLLFIHLYLKNICSNVLWKRVPKTPSHLMGRKLIWSVLSWQPCNEQYNRIPDSPTKGNILSLSIDLNSLYSSVVCNTDYNSVKYQVILIIVINQILTLTMFVHF